MIGRAHPPARQDHVADARKELLTVQDVALALIREPDAVQPKRVEGATGVQPDHIVGAGIAQVAVAAGARIDQAIRPGGQGALLRGGQRCADIPRRQRQG